MHLSFIFGSKTVAFSSRKNFLYIVANIYSWYICDCRWKCSDWLRVPTDFSLMIRRSPCHRTKGPMQLNQHAVSTCLGLVPGVGDTLEKKRYTSCPHGVTFADSRGSPGNLSVNPPFSNELKSGRTSPLSFLHYSCFPEKHFTASHSSDPWLCACLVLSLLLKQMILGGGRGLVYSLKDTHWDLWF